jgi:hypothetical protein
VPKAPSSATPNLSALARRRLRDLAPVDVRTPEERKRDNDALLQKIQRMRPDLYERVSKVVADSDEDWFDLLERHLGKEITADVAEIILMEEY